MITRITPKNLFSVLALVTFLVGIPFSTFAKVATYNTTSLPTFYGSASADYFLGNMDLDSINLTINYEAKITNTDNGTNVGDGATVPFGSHLHLAFTPHQSTDIFWFGNGGPTDSPYGQWIQNAAPGAYGCFASDKLNNTPYPARDINSNSTPFFSYINLSINPPVESISPGPNLTCGSVSTASDGTASIDCTVTGGGSLNPTFTTADSYGQFHDRYQLSSGGGCYVTYGKSQVDQSMWATCRSILIDPFMCARTPSINTANGYGPDVPPQTISFNFTATAAPTPAAPTVTGSGGTTCQPGSFTFSGGTDPGGHQIKYGIDWNNDGVVDAWAPAAGYVNSGTSQVAAHTWGATGPQTFKVLTENDQGADSTFTSYTTSVAACPVAPVATLTDSNGGQVQSGSSATLNWSCTGSVTSASIDQGVGAVSPLSGGSVSSGPITAVKQFTLTCTGPGGSNTNSDTISLTPPPDLTPTGLTPSGTVAGQNTPFTGTVLNNGGSATPQFESSMYICPQGDSACKATGITMNIWQRIFAFFVNVAHAATQVKVVFSRMTLAAGASGNQTATYNFPTPGSYEIRYCVDLPKNEVTELDENNNCQNWTAFTVCPTGQLWNGTSCVLPTLSCSPSPSSVNPTNNVTWTANPQGYTPTTYVWTTPPGGAASTFTNSYNVSGAHYATVRAYNGTTDLTADCSPVTVNGSCGVTPNTSLTASPDLIGKGKTSTLTYSAGGFLPNTGTCTITGTDGSTWTTPTVDNLCTESGTHVTPPINARTVFTLHCTNGATDATATVNVSPSFTEF
jgi:hypothetical protein